MVDAFVAEARAVFADLDAPSMWDAFLRAEPSPTRSLPLDRVGEVAAAFAHYADIKSPYTLGHSTGVARLAVAAADHAGVAPDERERLRVAALLHDIGRVSVPNGVWDKRGPLDAAEWERVRMHAYHTERILAQTPLLRPYADIACADHERLDGKGYYRRVPGSLIARPGRLLAVADAYHAMTEDRAHRRALAPDTAARALTEEARQGRLDRDAVKAVLAAAGHRAMGVKGRWPAGLSDREIEVLCLLARALEQGDRQTAVRLIAHGADAHVPYP